MIIDTHAHLMFDDFKDDLTEVVARANAAGVERIINVGTGVLTSEEAIQLSSQFEGLYATVGFHPYDAADCSTELLDEWKGKILTKEKGWGRVVAIGECGLDYYKGTADPVVQRSAFEMQLELALSVDLPVVIHNRSADDECLEILKKFKGVRAVFHCFGSDLEFAKRVWDKGFMTSITGIVTFKNAEELRKVVEAAPVDKLMVETDCPYLSPEGRRGKRNEPANVVEVVKKIAEIRAVRIEDARDMLKENSERFFNLT
jgi:TatD DNase family protein